MTDTGQPGTSDWVIPDTDEHMGAKEDTLHEHPSPTAQLAQATAAGITTVDGIEFQDILQTNERLTPQDAHTTTAGLSVCDMTNSEQGHPLQLFRAIVK